MLNQKGSFTIGRREMRTPTKHLNQTMNQLANATDVQMKNQFSFHQSMLNQHVRMRKLLNQSVDFKANPKSYNFPGRTNRYAVGSGIIAKNADIIDTDNLLERNESKRARGATIVSSQGETTKLQSEEEHLNARDSIATVQSIDSQALASKLRVMKQFKPQLPSVGPPRLKINATNKGSPEGRPFNFSTLNYNPAERSLLGPADTMTDKKSENWRRSFIRNRATVKKQKLVVSEQNNQTLLVTDKSIPSPKVGEMAGHASGSGAIPELDGEQHAIPAPHGKNHWIADLKIRLMKQQQRNSISFGRQSEALRINEPKAASKPGQFSENVSVENDIDVTDKMINVKSAEEPKDQNSHVKVQNEDFEDYKGEKLASQRYVDNLLNQIYTEDQIKTKDFFIKRSTQINDDSGENPSFRQENKTEKTNTADLSQGYQQQHKQTDEHSRSYNQSYDEGIKRSIGKSGRTQNSMTEENANNTIIQYDAPQKIVEDWNEDSMVQNTQGNMERPISGSKRQSSTARFTSTQREVETMYDKLMAELDENVNYMPDDHDIETPPPEPLVSRNIEALEDVNYVQSQNYTIDPTATSFAMNPQPYAININYIENQFNNFPDNDNDRQRNMNIQSFAPMTPQPHPQNSSINDEEFQNLLPQNDQQFQQFAQTPMNQTGGFHQGGLVLNKQFRKSRAAKHRRQGSIQSITQQHDVASTNMNTQMSLASNQISRPLRDSYIRNSKNMMRTDSQVKTPYTCPQPEYIPQPKPPPKFVDLSVINRDLGRDFTRNRIDRLIANYRNVGLKTGSQSRYQVYPSKLISPYDQRAQQLLEQPNPDDIVNIIEKEIENQDQPSKFLFKHVVSQRGQNFYYKISKADYIKEQKPKIKVVKVMEPRPKTPPRKFIVPPKPKRQLIKKKVSPPPPPPKEKKVKKEKSPPRKKMRSKEQQTEFTPKERSVCSTERIINIQTLKVRPHITHQSLDLAKDRTKSILKQASHFITENGEIADYHIAHVEELYYSADGHPRPMNPPLNRSIAVSKTHLQGGGFKPMTAFMDYKDYRIQYENKNNQDSSFDSSKDNYYCGNSANQSFYEKTKINREIRRHDREKAKQKGQKYELANSDQQFRDRAVRKENEGEDTTSAVPSYQNFQLENTRRSNVKIKSFIAAARDTINNQSREFSRLRERSVDYFGAPIFNGNQFSKSFDKAFQGRSMRQKHGVYRSHQMLADDSSRRRSAEPTYRGKKGLGGILQQPRSQIRTQRMSARKRLHVQVDGNEENEARRSVTFENLSPSSPKSATKNLVIKPQLRKLRSMSLPDHYSIIMESVDSFRSHAKSSSKEIIEKEDNQTQEGTVALKSNDLWRRHPDLELIQHEYNSIANKNIRNPDVTRRMVDWFYTVLYRNIYETGNADIEADPEDKLFYTTGEVMASLQELITQHSQQPKHQDKSSEGDEQQEQSDLTSSSYKDLLVLCFVKALNTMRRILVHEVGLPRVYDRYLVLHADDITYVNTTRLLIRCKKLLHGRKLLGQILTVIIERNKLVNSLKQLIALDDAAQAQADRMRELELGQSNIIQSSYGMDLGDFKFDEDLARDLGEAIVKYTLLVQQLIAEIIKENAIPGMSTNKTQECIGDLFVFKGTDFVKYVRRETNEIKHLLFVYRIVI